MRSGAKSYMRKGFLINEEMHKYFHQYEGQGDCHTSPIPLTHTICQAKVAIQKRRLSIGLLALHDKIPDVFTVYGTEFCTAVSLADQGCLFWIMILSIPDPTAAATE